MELPPKKDIWGDRMRAAIAGDAVAYKALLADLARTFRITVRATVARGGYGNEDVEDIVQETLLAVHLKRDSWNPELPFSPWVNAIARYKIADTMRRRGRRVIVQIDDFEGVIPAPETDDSEIADAGRLIARLDARAQRIVRAISLEGLSTSQVAAELGLTDGAVRVALHRALQKLAEIYRSDNQ